MFRSKIKRSLQTLAKVLGLIFVAGGIWMAIGALVMAFNPPSYAELITRGDLPPAIKTALEGLQAQGTVLMRQVVAAFVLHGVLPIVLGCLLMRAGGWLRGSDGQRSFAGERSPLRRFFMPRMSLALARIEAEAERGYRPFTLGS